jgi:hypothetical protein
VRVRRTHWLIFLLLLIAGAALNGAFWQPADARQGDSPSFLLSAWHLLHHGTYSAAPTAEPPTPSVGREPAYPVLLAGLLLAQPGFSPACLTEAPCPAALYVPAQLLNLALTGVAALAVLYTALGLGLPAAAALIAPAYLLLNVEGQRWWVHVMSDHLALCLMALLSLALVRLFRSPSIVTGLMAGAALVALCLTKVVFMALAPLLVLVLLFAGRRYRGPAMALLAIFLVSAGGWSLRNRAIGEIDIRPAIALNAREALNHMNPAQIAAAFVYWTRGFGDDLARRWFDAATVGPFDPDRPGGFYDEGQHGLEQRVAARVAAGTSYGDAAEAERSALYHRVLGELPAHLAASLPLFTRGIWIDEFILIGLPCLAAACLLAWRRRRLDVALAMAPGVYSLLAYPLVSINIPRYQMTALPSLALATCFVAAVLFAYWQRRRETA